MKDFPIALEVLSFLLPLRQRFISCHLRKSACTFKSCDVFGEESNSLLWQKISSGHFMWESFEFPDTSVVIFTAVMIALKKMLWALLSPLAKRANLILADMYLFLLSSLTICCFCVAKDRKDKKELLFHLFFLRCCRWFLALEQSGSREYLRSRVAAIDCKAKSYQNPILPIKPTQPLVHTQMFCFQMLHFALAPFTVVILSLSTWALCFTSKYFILIYTLTGSG